MYSSKPDASSYGMSDNGDKLVVKLSSIVRLILLFILILPSAVFSLGSIYESLTPATISYDWLNYKFGVLQLIICLFGAVEIICQKQRIFLIIFFIEFLREILFYFAYDNSLFNESAYEMYLTVFVGYSLFLIVRRYMNDFRMMDKFYGLFLITNMLTIYINVAMGGRGTTSTDASMGAIAGRYHASNLDVGGTGTLCLLCIIYLYFSHIKNIYRYPLLILSFLGLILCGSRTAMLFAVVLLFYYIIKYLYHTVKFHKTRINESHIYQMFFLLVALGVFCIWGYENSDFISDHINFERFQALLTLSAFSSDGSVLGRFASIQAGLDILFNNPLGISGYFINLQTEMAVRGFPTFPHSSLLSGYLLYGPIILLVYIVWGHFLNQNYSYDNKYFWMILYYIFSTITAGGPIVNFKIIFVMIIVSVLAYMSLSEAREKKNDY
jgi:hypothetical protein